MPDISTLLGILATPDRRLREMHQYLNRPAESHPWSGLLFWLLVLASAAALLILALRYARFDRRDRALGNPWRIFLVALWRLPLSWRQRWRLVQLARTSCPDAPLAILLTPSALQHAARSWARGRPRINDDYLARHIQPISRKLFGEQ